jgi:hypothetical protein
MEIYNGRFLPRYKDISLETEDRQNGKGSLSLTHNDLSILRGSSGFLYLQTFGRNNFRNRFALE